MLKLNCLKLKLLLDYLWLEMEEPGQISVYMQFHKQGGVAKSLEHPNMHRMRNTKSINHCSQSQKREQIKCIILKLQIKTDMLMQTCSWVPNNGLLSDNAQAYACLQNGCKELPYSTNITNFRMGYGTFTM